MRIIPWKAGLMLALFGAGISIADYVSVWMIGPLPLYKFIPFVLGWGLICFMIGQGLAWGFNSHQQEKNE